MVVVALVVGGWDQVLYFNDVELDDGQILGSYGVTDGSVLRMWSGDLIAAKGKTISSLVLGRG